MARRQMSMIKVCGPNRLRRFRVVGQTPPTLARKANSQVCWVLRELNMLLNIWHVICSICQVRSTAVVLVVRGAATPEDWREASGESDGRPRWTKATQPAARSLEQSLGWGLFSHQRYRF